MEHDACGVGLVVSTEGKKSRKSCRVGNRSFKSCLAQGAIDADGKTGDGAGIHIEIPVDFFVEKIEVTGHTHDNSGALYWNDIFTTKRLWCTRGMQNHS